MRVKIDQNLLRCCHICPFTCTFGFAFVVQFNGLVYAPSFSEYFIPGSTSSQSEFSSHAVTNTPKCLQWSSLGLESDTCVALHDLKNFLMLGKSEQLAAQLPSLFQYKCFNFNLVCFSLKKTFLICCVRPLSVFVIHSAV